LDDAFEGRSAMTGTLAICSILVAWLVLVPLSVALLAARRMRHADRLTRLTYPNQGQTVQIRRNRTSGMRVLRRQRRCSFDQRRPVRRECPKTFKPFMR
jgi:hypothetical protein